MTFERFASIPPYALAHEEKAALLTERLRELTALHAKNCPAYGGMLAARGVAPESIACVEDVPFLPVSLFKRMELRSVEKSQVFKTMTSSGTSGQAVSKIFVDRATATHQQQALVKIVSSFTGTSRMPMLIIDSPSVVADRRMFSARGAGILGFSIFGTDKTYALDDDMRIDIAGVESFLDKHQGQRVLLFGFTFMVWQYFYRELVRLADEGKRFDLSRAVLIHGGGWKKLQSEAVTRDEFHARLHDVCGMTDVHDYYGMVEQTGCVSMECECGHLHTSVFSDIIPRRPLDFAPCAVGETGILQVLSVIPESYPGHSLLTEDEGALLGEDDCPCGRKGKYFRVDGRLRNAEIRGCSDTYAASF